MASTSNFGSGKSLPSCFTCDQEILGAKISLSNSVTTHSSTAIPVKISELMGEEFLVILTGDDYICKRCNVLFNLMDRLQSELSIVQNALLGHIRSKYNLPGMSDTNTPSEIQLSVNGVPYGEFAQKNNLQSSPVKAQVNNTSTKTQVNNTPIKAHVNNTPIKAHVNNTPIKSHVNNTPIKAQVNNTSLSSSVSNSSLLPNTSTNEPSGKTTKVYKCGFCDFQSKDLLIVKDHIRQHVNNNQKKAEKRLGSPIAQRPIKRKLFRCQVCAASYFDRKSCLNHIKANHSAVDNQISQKAGETKDPVGNSTEISKESHSNSEGKVVNGNKENDETVEKNFSNEAARNIEAMSNTNQETETSSAKKEVDDESKPVATVTDSDSNSKNIGLDLEAMLAALHSDHSEVNNSNNCDTVEVPEL